MGTGQGKSRRFGVRIGEIPNIWGQIWGKSQSFGHENEKNPKDYGENWEIPEDLG